jgi:hypothetical protein
MVELYLLFPIRLNGVVQGYSYVGSHNGGYDKVCLLKYNAV